MGKKETAALTAVIILAIAAGIAGFTSGIPSHELYLHPEFDVPVGIALIILIILGKSVRNKDDDDK